MPKVPQKPEMTVDQIVEDCRALGVVGERNLVIAIYLVGTSRLLHHPLSAIVQGASSSGKSFLVSKIASLFPPRQVIEATRMTPQALYHMRQIKHKFVVAGERSRTQDDASADATAALRQLQSEGRIVKQITEKDGDEFVTNQVEVEGPIAYVETTTLRPGRIFPEDLNRALLLTTDDSPNQTEAILLSYANHERRDTKSIVERHREFQESLQRREVVIPFDAALMQAIPTAKVEARRVGKQVLSMIQAVTLLHQADRDSDEDGRLIATLDDYEVAASVLRQPVGSSLGTNASATQLHEKLADKFGESEFSTADAQTLDDATDRAVRGWLSDLHTHGCIEQIQPSKGRRPATWRMNGRSPDDLLLPKAESLDVCRNDGKPGTKSQRRQRHRKRSADKLAGKPERKRRSRRRKQ